MTAIERDNPSLKGVLPKDHTRPGLDKQRLGQLILDALRDTLLPKLISGELRAPVWQDVAELADGVGPQVAP